MVTPAPNALATYCCFGNLLLLGIVFFPVIIFVAIAVLDPRLEGRISMPSLDILESGYDLINRLLKNAGTILALLIKGAFAILAVFIVLWALLIVIGVGWNIIFMAFGQMHPHLP
ncbi:hypothetical protein MCP_1397 [Methanocella paludicola SANAE]|uniref:Uncharacterized protein n=1 Tax=Methanocella paludicola (strain DSM 17711 / JCM 13418 / NBRC 101707 / SANAE) TaxID=304371 RepID=D1YYE7_METPS|nr:hypothetical protein [Methanocella paludicola]BAI61469.1 hypothetical protein MCP_1397 [Methanocella paludicola SANAE]